MHLEQHVMSCVQTVMFMSISQCEGVYSFMCVADDGFGSGGSGGYPS